MCDDEADAAAKYKGLSQRPKTLDEYIADDPLGEFFVWWQGVKEDDLATLEKCIDDAWNERPVQRFLEENPLALVQHMKGGHGRYVIPQKRLGAEHVTDFMIGQKHSGGFEWEAVELESPRARMFTSKGDPTSQLTHAIRQIQDWRAWLRRNQDYAARPRSESGLGLTDIGPELPGFILIGRRQEIPDDTNDRRRQMVNDLNIRIHSYDFLLAWMRGKTGRGCTGDDSSPRAS